MLLSEKEKYRYKVKNTFITVGFAGAILMSSRILSAEENTECFRGILSELYTGFGDRRMIAA